MADLVVRDVPEEHLKKAKTVAFNRGITLKQLIVGMLERLPEVSHESVGAAVQPEPPGRGSGGVEGASRPDGARLELAGIKARYLTDLEYAKLRPADQLKALREGRYK